MKWQNGYRMRIVLIGVVAAVVLGGGNAKADFTFGEPTNLGTTVNSSADEGSLSVSASCLESYFASYNKPGGHGHYDIWVTKRKTIDEDWGSPVNLGPTINSPSREIAPEISSDGLTLYFHSDRPGGYGDRDIWMTRRASMSDHWREPENLGPIVNSPYDEAHPSISSDGLSLYFNSDGRPGGYGEADLWVATRLTTEDPWSPPVHLGPMVNSSHSEFNPEISADGLALFFVSNRPGGFGGQDLWVTIRATENDDWDTPLNLGPMVNNSSGDGGPALYEDGFTLYFNSDRTGGMGGKDIWQAPIIPIVDINGDGIVDSADMCIMVDHWGTDEPLCDIGPMP
ncbi:MAG: PD40 domain-containing protein [Phycisphaerae bacterium]|nr:PD40 domain-containing protein [Phycisphaerae bacterium]